jgi:hypothetical protein
MENNEIRLYSAIDSDEGVGVRQLGPDDRETDPERRVPAEDGRWVVDANYDGRHKTTVDLQDLLQYIDASEPGLIQRLLSQKRASPKEAFATLVQLNDRVQGMVVAAHASKNAPGFDAYETAYNLVFSDDISRRAYALCKTAGITLEWCDIDGSYEDDVCAFARGFDRLIDSHKAYFEALPE